MIGSRDAPRTFAVDEEPHIVLAHVGLELVESDERHFGGLFGSTRKRTRE